MSLVNLTGLRTSNTPLRSSFTKKGNEGFGGVGSIGRTVEASITYSSGGVPAFTVQALKKVHPGRKGLVLNFGCLRQAGVRYILFLYEDDNDKLDGTISTAGVSEGATTAAGIVAKINSTSMNGFLKATLHTDATNIDYTGHSAINLANTDPLTGGRG